MAYPEKEVVKQWLDALEGLPVQLKKMFGCLCVYCGGSRWAGFTGQVFSLREVGLSSPRGTSAAPSRAAPSKKSPSLWSAPEKAGWRQAVKETAQRRREEKASP